MTTCQHYWVITREVKNKDGSVTYHMRCDYCGSTATRKG